MNDHYFTMYPSFIIYSSSFSPVVHGRDGHLLQRLAWEASTLDLIGDEEVEALEALEMQPVGPVGPDINNNRVEEEEDKEEETL